MVLPFSSFSTCGSLYAHCGSEGKLKIWEAGSGVLKQEYTPNLHLTSPYTCLTWIYPGKSFTHKKKKRKCDGEGGSPLVAMGTQAGGVVLYSVAEGTTVGSLNDVHKTPILCMAWRKKSDLFSCSRDTFVHWDTTRKSVRSKWKNGDICSAMAVCDDGEILVTASHSIKWWNVADRTVVRTFTGHTTSVVKLVLLTVLSGDHYVISAAQNDRLLNVWSLSTSSDNQAVSSLLMSDLAHLVTANISKDNIANVAAVTQSGALHLYSQQLNGKCGKPVKPSLTVLIASETSQSKAKVLPLNIIGTHLYANLRAHIVYGHVPFLAFEIINLEHSSNELCLVRKDPKLSLTGHEEIITKVKVPDVNKDVQYLSGAAVMNGTVVSKRGRGKERDVPMEQRLENLALNQPLSSGQPQSEGLAHLLIQALQSKDKSLLQSVLFKKNEVVIGQTVQRLPVQVIHPLMKELMTLLQGKTFMNQMAAMWLKTVLSAHAGQLLSDPSVDATFQPLLTQIEARLGCITPLSRLRGRLDLLLHQLTGPADKHSAFNDTNPVIVIQDQDSTEEGSDTMGSEAEGDESEDCWDELSDDEVEPMESEDLELST